MLKIYKDKDASLKYLRGKTISILGYGSQGRAQALNLRDSGLKVIIGLPGKSKDIKAALKDGFKVLRPDKAVGIGNIISVLAPDHTHKELYEDSIRKNLSPEKALVFAHAYSIHFGLIKPSEFVDVVLVAPHGPGVLVRELFLEGKGVRSFIAVEKNYSGKALDKALAYAKGIGSTKAGVIQTTFEDEAIGDLFGEQAVLCGGLSELLKAGFETLVESGLPPENAYLECVYQLDLIVELIKKYGIAGMFDRISQTAEYGSYLSGKKIIDKNQMTKVLSGIKNGKFTGRWMKEYENGMKNYKKMKRYWKNHLLQKTWEKLSKFLS
ncbi:MAG TPA: ketol-acid reductoisomerase [Terriglobales bacterium]|nr:ketol-acid reductoisomerase [Terriglobales bacterium]